MKTPKSLEYPEAYNQRDVLTLKPLNQWTQEEELVHWSIIVFYNQGLPEVVPIGWTGLQHN